MTSVSVLATRGILLIMVLLAACTSSPATQDAPASSIQGTSPTPPRSIGPTRKDAPERAAYRDVTVDFARPVYALCLEDTTGTLGDVEFARLFMEVAGTETSSALDLAA